MADSESRQSGGELGEALDRVFGFHAFRPNQEGIVRAILAGRDVFAVMPTGGGKSLCYQLPAHLLCGTCVVISPLISLMKDQVDAAKGNGLQAEVLNSSLAGYERAEVFERLTRGDLDLLYVAPERLTMDGFLDVLGEVKLSLFAIDEAHCISEWGHDFRPDYLALSELVRRFPDCPLAAFTATATRRVQDDIIDKLSLRSPHTVRASFDRPNLFYQVVPKDSLNRQVLAFVRARPDEGGILYRTTRDNVERTAAFLSQNGVSALPYHAGLDADVRKDNQNAFNRDEIQVIVATIAFGMGIDKSNVRFVLHGDLPKNVEGYYQETGRAGRDGEPAACVLYFGAGDIPKIRYFIDQVEDDAERKVATDKLYQMVNFATVNACRRRQLLAYFGEELDEDNCGTCDICTGEVEQVDATTDAQILMSAIARTGERFGAGHVVDVVTAADTQRVRDLHHDEIKTYGAGKDKPKGAWRKILDNLIAQGCLVQEDGRYPVLHLTDAGRDVLFGRREFRILKQKEKKGSSARRKGRARAAEEIPDYDAELFEQLRATRRTIARGKGVPPYVVFSDRTLHELAAYLPTTRDQMRGITGVGEKKLGQYADDFLPVIRSFTGADADAEDPSPPAKAAESPAGPGRSLEATWELVEAGLSYEQIAEKRGIKRGTIAAHVEQLILAGRPIDVDDHVRPATRIKIERLFGDLNTTSLRQVVDAGGESVTYDQARIVRAWLQTRDG